MRVAVAIGRLLLWVVVAGGRLLGHAVTILLHAVLSAGRWARHGAVALGRAATSFSRERVAERAESMREASFPRWDLPSALPAAGSPIVPIAIMLAAVLIAATLGGVLAAALN